MFMYTFEREFKSENIDSIKEVYDRCKFCYDIFEFNVEV